ncbi:phage holin family protein [Amnibacterium sp.]|uniref:phage holin family protein n=1 Tax=Amnibacterium sp. TaxID=1872496 RepID=UPI003F7BD611
MAAERSDGKKSVFALIGELPGLITTLIRDEFEQIKREAVGRLKSAGIGIALFLGAAVFLYFAAFPLMAAVILGIGEALPLWLSALIVGVALLLVAVVLALIGVSRLKKGVPPVPKEAVDSVKDDVKAFKGVQQYDR